MRRKTHTSSEVKDRYNRKHYEQIIVRTANGGRQAIQELAELHGLSVTAYIRHLVIADGERCGKRDISAILGGGGQEQTSTVEILPQLSESCTNSESH